MTEPGYFIEIAPIKVGICSTIFEAKVECKVILINMGSLLNWHGEIIEIERPRSFEMVIEL